VKLLLSLKDERIDISQPNDDGKTPFWIACHNGRLGVVKLLLSDPRIDVNQPSDDGRTPLWIAYDRKHYEIMQCILASGKEVNLDVQDNNKGKTIIDIAMKEQSYGIVRMLNSFLINPNQTRFNLRIQLGLTGNTLFLFLFFIFILFLFYILYFILFCFILYYFILYYFILYYFIFYILF